MKINADFARRASVHVAQSQWVASPMAGVERLMLDRVGEEVARATSLVRYAPQSYFSPHRHDGGEEFFVLEGVFQDQHGDYPTGTYVRNPPGTEHRPFTERGCTIFVKLWQFELGDDLQMAKDSTPQSIAADTPVARSELFASSSEQVRVESWQAGACIDRPLQGGIEVLCLDGSFVEGGEQFDRWSWLRLPRGSVLHARAGSEGCRVLVKEGHLPKGLVAVPVKA
jgi:anti-sigma factor ChrR (cupin superfamily)